ncbi:MAG: hypothetical protein C0399_06725 [Syntrophus sp. (in: bacteria)]|nr:hypothetical protein [Syntrophus sp. (in: bacteria)]
MYSPRIKEDLIHRIYQLGRHTGKNMVEIVDDIIRPALERFNETGLFRDIENEEKTLADLTDYFQNIITNRKKKTADVIELLRKIA